MSLHLVYKFYPHPEGIEHAAVPPEHGAADAAIVLSIVKNEGHTSYMTWSVDGKTTKALTDEELFSAWVTFAHQLSESKGLGEGRKLLCSTVIEIIRNAVKESSSVH